LVKTAKFSFVFVLVRFYWYFLTDY